MSALIYKTEQPAVCLTVWYSQRFMYMKTILLFTTLEQCLLEGLKSKYSSVINMRLRARSHQAKVEECYAWGVFTYECMWLQDMLVRLDPENLHFALLIHSFSLQSTINDLHVEICCMNKLTFIALYCIRVHYYCVWLCNCSTWVQYSSLVLCYSAATISGFPLECFLCSYFIQRSYNGIQTASNNSMHIEMFMIKSWASQGGKKKKHMRRILVHLACKLQ